MHLTKQGTDEEKRQTLNTYIKSQKQLRHAIEKEDAERIKNLMNKLASEGAAKSGNF